eukprot:5415328-Pyramimonas_sp.AAC.1
MRGAETYICLFKDIVFAHVRKFVSISGRSWGNVMSARRGKFVIPHGLVRFSRFFSAGRPARGVKCGGARSAIAGP